MAIEVTVEDAIRQLCTQLDSLQREKTSPSVALSLNSVEIEFAVDFRAPGVGGNPTWFLDTSRKKASCDETIYRMKITLGLVDKPGGGVFSGILASINKQDDLPTEIVRQSDWKPPPA